MIKNDSAEGALGQVTPEIIALSGQTANEVKDILKKTNDPTKDELDNLRVHTFEEVCRSHSCSAGYFEREKCEAKALINKEGDPHLIFEDLPNCVDAGFPRTRVNERKWSKFKDELSGSQTLKVLAGLELPQEEKLQNLHNAGRVQGDFEQFCQWRKTAGLQTESDDLTSDALNPAKELMDLVVIKLTNSFPSLSVEWTKGTWNPRLLINDSATQISLERIAVSYKGLLCITDDTNAQAIIANIIIKKVKELFI